jgi:hypothetical protein
MGFLMKSFFIVPLGRGVFAGVENFYGIKIEALL